MPFGTDCPKLTLNIRHITKKADILVNNFICVLINNEFKKKSGLHTVIYTDINKMQAG
jgi:hypothetical protein